MENEAQGEKIEQVESKSVLHSVTPLSKYLALALFIILPFIGGWIGYTYAPGEVVEVERVVVEEIDKPITEAQFSEILSTKYYKRLYDYDQGTGGYVSLDNQIYSLEGAETGNSGKNSFVKIPTKSNHDMYFTVEEYDFSCFDGSCEVLALGITVEGDVYYRSVLLDGVNADSMVVDSKRSIVYDEDAVYIFVPGCYKPSLFRRGTRADIENYIFDKPCDY